MNQLIERLRAGGSELWAVLPELLAASLILLCGYFVARQIEKWVDRMLKKLDFAYPHHQAIGFYLERAGYRASTLDLLRRCPMRFDFYLTHGMAETRFDKTWRVHVPQGF